VLYTGGLENYPHVVRELAAGRELWGNPPEVLEQVRDPFTLFPALARAGFATPRLVPPGEPCPAEGRWLRKPLRSGGGLGIRFARPGEAASPQHYFQEFIDGTPMSALFVSGALVGVTEQLIGEPRLHARPFAYCGNVGPAALPPATLDQLARFGEEARAGFALRGPWGLDFLHDGTTPRPAELNPRYTASVEVLEFATGATVWDDPFPASWAIPRPWRGPGTVGKAIYYAPHAIRFPQSGPWDADLAGEFDPWRLPGFADIPDHGGVIEPGSPVLTFFAGGSTPAEVRERLQSRAAELDTLFRSASP
jgi:predicted ATP-grasp superfamily ATP-dependent carboligase